MAKGEIEAERYPGGPNGRDSAGRTELAVAAGMGDARRLMELLADVGRDPNARGELNWLAPIAEAAYWGRARCAQILLVDPRVDPNILDATGRTPLLIAAEMSNVSTVRALIGASDLGRRCDEGEDALSAAAFSGSLGCVRLLAKRVDPRARAPDGSTALMRAAESGSAETLRHLMPLSDVGAVDDSGENALMKAARWGSSAAMRELLPRLDARAANAKGQNALDIAREALRMGVSEIPEAIAEAAKFLEAYVHALGEAENLFASAAKPSSIRKKPARI